MSNVPSVVRSGGTESLHILSQLLTLCTLILPHGTSLAGSAVHPSERKPHRNFDVFCDYTFTVSICIFMSLSLFVRHVSPDHHPYSLVFVRQATNRYILRMADDDWDPDLDFPGLDSSAVITDVGVDQFVLCEQVGRYFVCGLLRPFAERASKSVRTSATARRAHLFNLSRLS